MLALLFCQLSGRQSLRDLVDGFNSKRAHHYHLGTGVIRRLKETGTDLFNCASINKSVPVPYYERCNLLQAHFMLDKAVVVGVYIKCDYTN
jgi:hypothetical protein